MGEGSWGLITGCKISCQSIKSESPFFLYPFIGPHQLFPPLIPKYIFKTIGFSHYYYYHGCILTNQTEIYLLRKETGPILHKEMSCHPIGFPSPKHPHALEWKLYISIVHRVVEFLVKENYELGLHACYQPESSLKIDGFWSVYLYYYFMGFRMLRGKF